MTREDAIKILRANVMVACDTSDKVGYDTPLNKAIEQALDKAIKALEQKPIEKCKWIKYDYRTICPKEHDVDNPYWRIPENRMETLKYCPYCGKEIEVEDD